MIRNLGLVTLLVLIQTVSSAQTPLQKISEGADSLKAVKGERVAKFYVLPFVTFSPETSLRFGAAAIYLFRKKNLTPETQLSSLRLPLSYTLNNQVKIKFEANYYSNRNKNLVTLRSEWLNFPLLFFGIGNSTTDADQEIYTTQYLNTEIGYLRSLSPSFFIGLGYRFFESNIVEFQQGGSLEQPGTIPGNTGSLISGFNINLRFDNRDNYLSATKGIYADLKIASYEPTLGSAYDFTRLDLDFRKYFSPFGRHVLALQVVTTNIWGDPSFETMALLGSSSIMRGHYEGRFRDKSLYAAQIEYRMPLGRSNWLDNHEKIPFKERWGLVGFFGLGDVASSFGTIDISKIKSSIGVGVRYLVLPKERINVRIDFGFGTQMPGLYFNIREAF